MISNSIQRPSDSHGAMPGSVTLLCSGELGVPERNVIKIVQFLGGTTRVVTLSGDTSRGLESLEPALPEGGCLITSVRALARLTGDPKQSGLPRRWPRSLPANVLVYGFGAAPEDIRVLRELSGGALIGVDSSVVSAHKIRVTDAARDLCRQVSGLGFEAAGAGPKLAFVGGAPRPQCTPLAWCGESPFLVRLRQSERQWLLLAGQDIADLDALVPHDTSVLRFFAGLAPLLMFLRNASPEGFWHNDAPAACFIVDDPLLKRRYGFLNYQKLLELMERDRFCTSIAFIPWNFKRSDRALAQRFAAYPHRYSLCVHGCDHTRGEFGAADHRVLQRRARQALERMDLHRKLSGVGYDNVMVFPQGIFSTAAMKALKSCGYLAAVNSTPYPVDAQNSLTLGDLLQVAVTRFANFPLFTRRYPHQLPELAWDLFMGKPGLVVEHHGFFRAGYGALAETVERLHRLEPRLQWSNLATTCSRACLKKADGNGKVRVRFFTDRFWLRNDSGEPQDYRLVRDSAHDPATAVSVDGRPVDVFQRGDGLELDLSLEPGSAAEVKVERGMPEPPASLKRPDRMHQAKVFLRRSLSEFRDNYVDRSRFLFRAARSRQA